MKTPEGSPASDSELAVVPPRPIRCRKCGVAVSDANHIFGPGGMPARRVFANPAGRVFELLNVRSAQSVESWGEPTTEHTWYAGYAWRVLVCASCINHIGWRFDAVAGGDPPAFFGLITSEIVESE